MKIYQKCMLFLLSFLSGTLLLSGQCANIELNSQDDINGFTKKYGNCTSIQDLIIRDTIFDIVQFDSLYNIERIEGRLVLWLYASEKLNIQGLRNLKYANDLTIYTSGIISTFTSLDTVNHLRFSYTDSTCYRAFDNLKYIGKSLWISPDDYCTSNHFTNFTTGPNFSLILSLGSTKSPNCIQRLYNNIETKNLKTLNLRAPYQILSKLNIIDSLETMIFSTSSKLGKSDFSGIEKLTKLKHIEILAESLDNFGDGFQLTYDLDTLKLSYNKTSLKGFRDIFPNLQTIDRRLEMIGNDALISLDFLKDAKLPQLLGDSISVLLQDNKLLEDCNINFLCEALARNAGSVIIEGNGAKCTKEEILKYCQTVGTLETKNKHIQINPNPTTGLITIQNLTHPAKVTIYNLSGEIVKSLTDIENQISIIDLPTGMYIIDIRNKEISERHKIVKVE